MNFTGTYKEQKFYEGENVSWVDVQELSGCNCYCDDEAKETLENLIREFPAVGNTLSGLWKLSLRKSFVAEKDSGALLPGFV